MTTRRPPRSTRVTKATSSRRRLLGPAAGPVISLVIVLHLILSTNAGPVRTWMDLRWDPGAWVPTAHDFPAGEATTLAVKEAWLSDAYFADPARDPGIDRLPGLRHLDWVCCDLVPGHGPSGVRVGELDVFTAVLEPDEHHEGPVDEVLADRLAWRILDHEYTVYAQTGVRPVPLGVTVGEPLFTDPELQDAVPLGDRTTTTRSLDGFHVDIDDGPHGYVGVLGTTTDVVTGEPRRVAVAQYLRDGYLIGIGLSAPTTADIAWEAELDRVVAVVDAKMEADPDGDRLPW
ncbi:hypothetical protein ACNHYB_10470 [Isoptericola jiangsuensis]|uniref:hypothetical protein n=1 Tax=Isoptericola jiangsuensis TaxID=548579 RepID=UPI003AAC26CE